MGCYTTNDARRGSITVDEANLAYLLYDARWKLLTTMLCCQFLHLSVHIYENLSLQWKKDPLTNGTDVCGSRVLTAPEYLAATRCYICRLDAISFQRACNDHDKPWTWKSNTVLL